MFLMGSIKMSQIDGLPGEMGVLGNNLKGCLNAWRSLKRGTQYLVPVDYVVKRFFQDSRLQITFEQDRAYRTVRLLRSGFLEAPEMSLLC